MNNSKDQLGRELQLVVESQPWSEIPGRLLKLLDSGLLDCRSHLEPAGAMLVWFGTERLSLGEASAGMGNETESALMQLIELREVAFRTGYEDGEPSIWYISMKGVREHHDMQPDAARSKADITATSRSV